jgi:hypothetical protein
MPIHERAERYSQEELNKLGLVDSLVADGMKDYLNSSSKSPYVIFGDKGSGKTLYAMKCSKDYLSKEETTVGHFIYKKDGRLQLRVGDKIRDVDDPSKIGDSRAIGVWIFDDFHYIAEAVVKGDYDEKKFATLLKKADELSKHKKVMMITDTPLQNYTGYTFSSDKKYQDKAIKDLGWEKLITDPDILYHFAKFDFIDRVVSCGSKKNNGLKKKSDSAEMVKMKESVKRGREERTNDTRFNKMTGLVYYGWKKLLKSHPVKFLASEDTLHILYETEKNPRRLMRVLNYFATDLEKPEYFEVVDENYETHMEPYDKSLDLRNIVDNVKERLTNNKLRNIIGISEEKSKLMLKCVDIFYADSVENSAMGQIMCSGIQYYFGSHSEREEEMRRDMLRNFNKVEKMFLKNEISKSFRYNLSLWNVPEFNVDRKTYGPVLVDELIPNKSKFVYTENAMKMFGGVVRSLYANPSLEMFRSLPNNVDDQEMLLNVRNELILHAMSNYYNRLSDGYPIGELGSDEHKENLARSIIENGSISCIGNEVLGFTVDETMKILEMPTDYTLSTILRMTMPDVYQMDEEVIVVD